MAAGSLLFHKQKLLYESVAGDYTLKRITETLRAQ